MMKTKITSAILQTAPRIWRAFLSDLAFGTAWSQWYYESFAGLNALPLSAALRTAICDDIATGTEALGLLATAELQKVVQSLTAQDARQVLERLTLEGPAGDESRCARRC